MLCDHCGTGKLRRQRLYRIVAGKTFSHVTFHMAIDALFRETIFVLIVLAQPERIGIVLMENIIIVTIPAGITGEIRRRIA